MTRRAGIYVRISEDKAGAGLGVARQREDCAALADRLGWQLVDTYTDNDVSAFSGKPRVEYRRLLADLDAGRIDAVLCWHTDRLHRSPAELEEFVSIAEKVKATTQTVTAGELDLATPSGRMVARILGSVARQEVEHKAERTRRAHLQAAQQGRWRGGGRPFGYEGDGVTVRDDEAAEVVRMLDAVQAGASLGSLASDLNGRGLTSTGGKPWEFTTLRQMLLRPRNAGLSTYKGEVLGVAKWPALVPEAKWRAVVDTLRDPERRKSSSNAPRWLLPGIATCGACGAAVRSGTVVSNREAGTHRTVYRCRATGRGHVARSAEPVDDLVTSVILARLARPDAADLLTAPTGPAGDLAEQIASMKAKLEALTEMFTDGLLTAEQLAAGSSRLRERVTNAEAALRSRAEHPMGKALRRGLEPSKLWDNLDVPERRDVVKALITVTLLPTGRQGNRFDPESVQIEWRTS